MVRILVCDDEGIQRAALRICIQRLQGLPLPIEEVREAAHGLQAVELCDSWHPDIVFLDLRMPIMGGLEAAAAIRQKAPGTVIIILTAYDEFNFAQEAIRIGVVDFLLKPASMQDLNRVLQKAMAQIAEQQAQAITLESLRRRVEEARPLIQQEYISDLLTSRKMSADALDEKRRFLNITTHPRLVMVMELDDAVQVSQPGLETDRQLRKEQVLMIVERETAELSVLLHRLGDGRIAILLPASSGERVEAQLLATSLAEKIRSAVNREVKLPLSIGIGRVVDTPLSLHQSYSDALQALGYKAVLGNNHVIHIQDVELTETASALPAEEELLQALRLGNQKQVDLLLKSLLELIERQEQGRLESMQWRMIELLVLMTRASVLGGASMQQATLANVRYLQHVTEATSPMDLRETVSQAADELVALLLAERTLRHQRLIGKVMQYMQKHYSEQLTLQDLSKVVYLSPFYFSHVFKEQTGMTFVGYIANLRLSSAKQLLRETLLPIAQIAEQVGYNEVNYFSRVFKKVEGLTPTEYRSRLAEQG